MTDDEIERDFKDSDLLQWVGAPSRCSLSAEEEAQIDEAKRRVGAHARLVAALRDARVLVKDEADGMHPGAVTAQRLLDRIDALLGGGAQGEKPGGE